MTLTIPLLIKVAGVLTDADSLPTASAVSPSGTATISRSAVGTYAITIADAVAGTTYTVSGEAIVSGVTVEWEKTATTASATLTTLAAVKLYMGISNTAQDAKLTALLTAASFAIENYCDRVFAEQTLIEYYDGRDNWRNGYLHLKQMPVTSIARIASEPVAALTVKNESAAVQLAQVQVTATGVTLTSTASAVSTTDDISFATCPTIGSLANAIGNAGFSATVTSTYSEWPSVMLRVPQGALNAKAGGLTNGAQLFVYTRELSVASINCDEGTVYGFFPVGFQQVEVRYTAGYAVIPADVQTACAIVVKALNSQSAIDNNLAYEKLGDYSWGRRTDQMIDLNNAIFADAVPLLAKYRRIRAM
jgi:hypothetical protein